MSTRFANENCSFPLTGPNCTENFADSLGGAYVAWQATLATAFVLMTLIGLFSSYRLIRKNGFCFALENALTYIATFCCFIGAIRQVDGNAWREVYPFWFAMLLYDLGTSAALHCWLMVLNSWAVFVCRVVVSSQSKLTKIVRHVYVASVVFAWVSQPFATLIEFVIHPIWIGKMTHYGLSLVLFAVWAGGGIYFATIIHRVLVEAQRRYGDISTVGSQTGNHAASTDAEMTATGKSGTATGKSGTATGTGTGNGHQDTGADYSRIASKRRRLAVRRIQRMNIVIVILDIVALAITGYSILNWLSNKWSATPPNVIPLPTAGGLLLYHLFDILHLLVSAATLWFYRVTRSQGAHGSAGRGHASTTGPDGATPQNRDPESLEESIGEEEVSESSSRTPSNGTSRRGSTQPQLPMSMRQSQSSSGFVGGDSIAWTAPASSK